MAQHVFMILQHAEDVSVDKVILNRGNMRKDKIQKGVIYSESVSLCNRFWMRQTSRIFRESHP